VVGPQDRAGHGTHRSKSSPSSSRLAHAQKAADGSAQHQLLASGRRFRQIVQQAAGAATDITDPARGDAQARSPCSRDGRGPLVEAPRPAIADELVRFQGFHFC